MGALRGRDQDFTATYSKLKARPSTPQAGGGKKIWNRNPVHLTAMICPELAARSSAVFRRTPENAPSCGHAA